MAKTIDDTVKSIEKEQGNIQKKAKNANNSNGYVSKIDKHQSKLEKIVNKTIDVGFMALSLKYYFTSTLLSFVGFSVADLITKKKSKKKLNRKEIGRSVFNGAADAATNAGVQEELYKIIEHRPNNTLTEKFTKTLSFNPGFIAPYLGYFFGEQYLRYDLGYVKAIKGLLNPFYGKELLKDFYHAKIKGQYWSTLKKVFTRVFPIHFFSMNYLTPEKFGALFLPLRMSLASLNDIILALAAKPKMSQTSKKQNEYELPTHNKKQNNYQIPKYQNKYKSNYKLAA